MTTGGLQVINDSGTIQIDQNYYNFMLYSKSTATTTLINTGTSTVIYGTTITVPTTKNPQIFFGVNSAYLSVGHRTVSGGSTSFQVYSNVATTFTYYVFVTDPAQVADSGYGLQVFREDGSLVFDARNRFLRFENVFQIAFGSTSFPLSPAGKTYAAALSFSRTSAAIVSSVPFTQVGIFLDFSRLLTNSVSVASFHINRFPGQASFSPQFTEPPQLIVADVTNY